MAWNREDRPMMLADTGLMAKARNIVYDEFYRDSPFGVDDVYIVWFSKTLQNWKALVSTNVRDDMYYEVTYNGDKRETYVDQYHKTRNVVVRDGPPPAFRPLHGA